MTEFAACPALGLNPTGNAVLAPLAPRRGPHCWRAFRRLALQYRSPIAWPGGAAGQLINRRIGGGFFPAAFCGACRVQADRRTGSAAKGCSPLSHSLRFGSDHWRPAVARLRGSWNAIIAGTSPRDAPPPFAPEKPGSHPAWPYQSDYVLDELDPEVRSLPSNGGGNRAPRPGGCPGP